MRASRIRYTPRMTPPTARPGRNEPCHCGSGRKYKQCCLEKDNAKTSAAMRKAATQTAKETTDTSEPQAPRPPKHQTQQPWKGAPSRGFVQRARTPRKVGGS
jgi:hypothetical protein